MKIKKAIIAVALIAPSIVLAQKVDMKLNLEEGKKYTQKTMLESVTKQTMQGQTMESNNSTTSNIHLKVIEDNGSTDTYETWYGSIDLEQSAMGRSMSATSDTTSLETVDPLSKIFAGMSDKKFKAKITEKGMVEEVMGLEEIVKNAASGMPGGPAAIEQISASMGDNGFAKSLELTTDIFPDKKIKVGDSWTKEQFTSTGLPIISKATYKLTSVENGTATIELKAQLETDPNNASTQMQGIDATLFYEGTREGTFMVDVESGWVTSGNIEDDIVGSMTIAPNEQAPDGMTIPLESKNKITISN